MNITNMFPIIKFILPIKLICCQATGENRTISSPFLDQSLDSADKAPIEWSHYKKSPRCNEPDGFALMSSQFQFFH